MYEVTGRSATFGDVKIGTFEREVIGEENYMSAEAGTEEMEDNVHTYLHLIEFDGGVKVRTGCGEGDGEHCRCCD